MVIYILSWLLDFDNGLINHDIITVVWKNYDHIRVTYKAVCYLKGDYGREFGMECDSD